MNYKDAIAELKGFGVNPIRHERSFSFGDKETCRCLFDSAFMEVEESNKDYQFLPEYSKVIDWMVDTQGKGLYLHGDCGRGKSVILFRVLPLLFYFKFKKVFVVLHSSEMQLKIDKYIDNNLIGIDEVGVEPLINNYGTRYEGFNRFVDQAEIKANPLFLTTNLTNEQMYERYGERCIDRISRLALNVEFKGKSLR